LFTERQEYYSNIFRLNSIYTPQVVVNGKKEFVGSNKNKLISTIDEQLSESPTIAIHLNAVQNNQGKIEVSYSIEGDNSKDEQVVLMLIQKMATNKIDRGENRGRTLHHINIVRQIFYMPIKESNTMFSIPADLKKEDVFVAGLLQNKRSGKVNAIQSTILQ
jgi:hypothetical protein